jgi:hypothetical protein
LHVHRQASKPQSIKRRAGVRRGVDESKEWREDLGLYCMNDIRCKVAAGRALGEPDLPLASKVDENPLLARLPHSNHAIRGVVKEGAAAIKSISPPPQQWRNVVGMDNLPKHLIAPESIVIWRRRFDTPFS